MHDAVRRQDAAFVDVAVARHGHAVAEHASPLDVGIVADVAFGHDEVVVADSCASRGGDSTVDNHVFAYGVVIADETVGCFAFPSEILWVSPDDCSLVNAVVASHAGAVQHRCIRHDFASVTYLHILVDESEGMDCYVGADFCRRVNMCQWACHSYSF